MTMTTSLSLSLERWLAVTAAVVGRAHEQAGIGCQDQATAWSQSGTSIVALADGAGSQRHAETGAAVVVEAVCKFITRTFAELSSCDLTAAKNKITDHLVGALDQAAQTYAVKRHELASTLLFVAVHGQHYLAGHVGDGMVMYERDGVPQVLSFPRRGEFANETTFVTSPDAAANMQLFRGSLQGITAFMLTSDGPAEVLYGRKEQSVAPAVQHMWRWMDNHPLSDVSAALTENLRTVIRQHTSDDCSLALLRHTTLTTEELQERSPTFQQSFLHCSARALPSRVRITESFLRAPESDIVEVSQRSGLSQSTVRRHLGKLRSTFGWHAESCPNETPVGPNEI